MNPIIQKKIELLKNQQQKIDEEKAKQEQIRRQIELKKIESKVPEAKIWVENFLFDLIAKEDLKIDDLNKHRYRDEHLPKELELFHIPDNIPIESIVKAIKTFSGLYVRESWQPATHDIDGPSYPAYMAYYVRW